MEENHFNRCALSYQNEMTMAINLPILRLFSGNLNTIFNIGIVFLTFIESYVFPFAIVKWMVLLTKYGGLLTFLNNGSTKKLQCSRYKYRLQLMTMCKGDEVDLNEVSHVSVLMEGDVIQLSYCGQECRRIPPALQKMYGAKTKYVDLSYNSIETLKGLQDFSILEELILDNNRLGDSMAVPSLPRLRTLSLNNNQITDLETLVDKISRSCPSLSYLSLLRNKACPNELSDLDKDDSDYQRYRYFVIYKLPKLRFLDSRRVSSSERTEAATRGQFMWVRRPAALPEPGPVPPVRVRPLPVDFSALGKHKGAYGKCQYKYTGKHSEGNRFIGNNDL